MEEKMDVKKKALIKAVSSLVCLILLVYIIFGTGLLNIIFNNQEYKVYKYAIECVEDELKFPDTATYPKFSKTTISKSKKSTEIILNAYSSGGHGEMENAWDVTGSGTSENALGMTMNYKFTVTVVLDGDGRLWCYECTLT